MVETSLEILFQLEQTSLIISLYQLQEFDEDLTPIIQHYFKELTNEYFILFFDKQQIKTKSDILQIVEYNLKNNDSDNKNNNKINIKIFNVTQKNIKKNSNTNAYFENEKNTKLLKLDDSMLAQQMAKKTKKTENINYKVDYISEKVEKNYQDQKEEKEQNPDKKQSNPCIMMIPQSSEQQNIYICPHCKGRSSNNNENKCENYKKQCIQCQGKGYLDLKNPLIRLINQVVDQKLNQLCEQLLPQNDQNEIKNNKSKNNNEDKQFNIHEGFICEECGKTPIMGARFKCSQCEDYNICQICEITTNHDHNFLKIKNKVQLCQKTLIKDNNEDEFYDEDFEKLQDLNKVELSEVPIQNDQKQDKLYNKDKKNKNFSKTYGKKIVNLMKKIINTKQEKKNVAENKQIRVKYLEIPLGKIEQPIDIPYDMNYIVKNIGDQKWPEDICFYNVGKGTYQDMQFKVESLEQGQQCQINLKLLPDKNLNETKNICWSLGQKQKNGQILQFGPYMEYQLKSIAEKQMPEISNEMKFNIQSLIDIFGRNETEWFNFISDNNLHNKNQEELIDIYLQQQQK